MDIKIDEEILLKNNLTLSEYLYLEALYNEVSVDEISKLCSILDAIHEDRLQSEGFIKIGPDNNIILRDKTLQLFNADALWMKFFNTFPIKSPSGRALSPANSNAKLAIEAKAKWIKKTKNKTHIAEHIIRCLEAEIDWRKKTNQLDYMNRIDTWLNKEQYYNHEHLLNDPKYNKDKEDYNDFM